MSEGPRRLQFKLLNIFAATFWTAVFCCGLMLFNRVRFHELVAPESEGTAFLVLGAVLFTSFPATIACLVGRWWMGALIGLGVFAGYVAAMLVAISIYGI